MMHRTLVVLLNLLFCAGCLCLAAQRGFAQTEESLTARLAASDEEQRLALLVDLSALFKTTLRAAHPATVAALVNILQSDTAPIIRTHAARTLELAGDPTASDGLLAALKTEKELATRKAIIYALARYHAPQVTAALLPLLKHKEQEVRATAAYALAELADTAAANALLEIVEKRRKDQDAFARSQAVRGLGRIGYQAATPVLLTVLQKDKAAIVRREAAIALGWLTTTQRADVRAALRTAAQDDDPYLREAAEAALSRISARPTS